MNIILFGPQGCGKGTQSEFIIKKYGLKHFSMGDSLREEIKKGTKLGQDIAKIINKGNLVPDTMTFDIFRNKKNNFKSGIILDGYPRTLAQLEFIRKEVKIDAAIEINLSEKESINRISTRRVCSSCGKNYNIKTSPPKKSGICDVDGEKLIQRDDDKPEEIKKRLNIYHSLTEPLKEEYKKMGILFVVDGSKSIKEVSLEIDKILKNIKARNE